MVCIEDYLHFVPSRAEGLPDVTEVVVRPDRLELLSAGRWVVFRFADIAKWPSPRWWHRLLAWFGRKPAWLPVADRDWFQRPAERYFRFYTTPPIVVCMPADEWPDREASTFLAVQRVLAAGGFTTFDLG